MNKRRFLAGGTGALTAVTLVSALIGGQGPVASAQGRLSAYLLVAAQVQPLDTSTSTTTLASSTTTSSSTTTTTTVPGQTTTTGTTTTTTTTTTVPPTTTTTVAAPQVMANALVAVQAERGVVWNYLIAAGTESIKETVHAGLQDGTLSDTLHLAKSGSVNYSLHGRMYFHGTANGLSEDLNFKSKYATAEAGKWISASAQNAPFLDLASIMTMGGVTSMLDLPGGAPKEEARTTARGLSVIPLEQSVKESGVKIVQTVYIRATGPALPVEIIREIDGVEGVITFSRWGQPPDATVPKKSTLFSASWLSGT